jgi:hypothetical protein
VYALIGIRNKGLHIFLSAAYLTSLAVTVLIIYVMNPPVSNGIQGAYVVAIVLTGLILGGAALLITDMTEGLGCLFGGFCVAMWLLVLKPGGLLTTVPQVTVFIVCFTIAGWATSFTSYTRPYGLIGLMSFGGATVVVLGIDIFSRAGLKEFWAYIWNLNQNLFPLGATSYPLTKGMKVEIAAIIIIFLVGIISQSKIWNFVKKRRERRALERLPDRRNLGREEEKVGRRIETATARQREYWETIYGSKDNTPTTGSGLDSLATTKADPTSTITSLDRSRQDPVEMDELSTAPAKSGVGDASGSIRPKSSAVAAVGVNNDGYPQPRRGVSFMATRTSRMSQTSRQSVVENGQSVSKRDSKMAGSRISAIPDFVPLPFTAHVTDGDDGSSVATAGDDDHGNRLSKRFSQGSELLRSLSQRSHLKPNRQSKVLSNSTEKLMESHAIEDDRSSVAATVDDMTDNEDAQSIVEGTPNKSPTGSNFEDKSSKKLGQQDSSKPPPHTKAVPPSSTAGSPASTEAVAQHPNQGPTEGTSAVQSEVKGDSEGASEIGPPVAEPQPLPLTKEALPPAMPKVASSYRTNEWAKHISNADVPEVEDLKLIHDTSAAKTQLDEAPTRVLIKDIQMRDEESQAMLGPKGPSAPPSFPPPPQPAHANSYQSIQLARLEPSATPTFVISRPNSRQSHKKQSDPQLHPLRTFRNSSTPSFAQTIVESPIEDQPFPSANTLLDKRESMIRNKSSGTTLALTPDASTQAPSLIRSSKSYNFDGDEDKILPLSRPSITRLSSSPAIKQNTAFDSHQPRRQSSTPVDGPSRDMQLAQWRASVKQDLETNVKPKKSLERSTNAMLQQRLIAERQKEMEQTRKGMRDSMFDERMRKGDMLDAHKEAMRKMQKEANRHIS